MADKKQNQCGCGCLGDKKKGSDNKKRKVEKPEK